MTESESKIQKYSLTLTSEHTGLSMPKFSISHDMETDLLFVFGFALIRDHVLRLVPVIKVGREVTMAHVQRQAKKSATNWEESFCALAHKNSNKPFFCRFEESSPWRCECWGRGRG